MALQPKAYSWEAWEFRHYPKNGAWYITLICVAILMMAFFIIVESDIFAAVTIAILTLLVIMFSRQKPRRVNIELNHSGIKFGNLFYPYKQIKYFWVVNNSIHKTVNFHTSAMINNVLILELEAEDPEFIRQYLLRYLPEHPETKETAIQRVMHQFKF
jgi:hypothetical protein